MSEKALKILIYVAGGACLFGFIAVRSLPVLNSVLVEKMIPEHWEFTKYGELYYFNYISEFREKLPEPIRKYRFSESHPKIEEADILMFGDSFLDISRQVTLPERLARSTGDKVFFHRFLAPQESNPFCVLHEQGVNELQAGILVYETVERNIPMKFTTSYSPDSCSMAGFHTLKARADRFAENIFPSNNEEMYTQLLKRSIFTSGIYSLNATAKFRLYGYVSSKTPLYKTGDDPWLFFHRQVEDVPGSFYYTYTAQEIENYCDNIARLASEVKRVLNMEMVFLPVPNKYTICHDVLNEDTYNQFLPRLYAGLRERGIRCVELYDRFSRSTEVLYYGTDTHWNERGVGIALEELIRTMSNESQTLIK